jgi:hypothetical protein
MATTQPIGLGLVVIHSVILYRSPVPALQVLVAVVIRLLVEDRMGGPPWAGGPWGPCPLQVMVLSEH